MGQGRPVGTAFAELNLDATPLERGLKRVNDQLVSGSIKVEDAYKSLGIKSDAVYEQMRKNATAAVDFIKNKTISSTEEIVRVQQAAANRIKQINEQQYGAQVSAIGFVTKNYLAMIGTATAAYMAVSRSTEAFFEEERAIMKMGMAMKNQGDYTRSALESMVAYSHQVQETTTVSHDAALAIMANLKTYGMSNEEVKRAAQAALSLAAAKQDEGMSVERASEIIGKSYLGITTGLKRMGIQISETTPQAQLFDKVVEQINSRFGGAAQAQLLTYGGQVSQLKNRFSELYEFLGMVATKFMQATAGVGAVIGGQFLHAIDLMVSGLGWLSGKLADFARYLGMEKVAASIDVGTAAIKKGSDWAKKAADEASKFAEANLKMAFSSYSAADALDKVDIKGQRLKRTFDEDAKGAAKLAEEIMRAEEHIAAAVEVIRARVQKNEMDAIKHNREEANRLFNEQEKGTKEYEKIVTESNDWSISEHQKAINQILSSEATKVARMYELWEAGTINLAQLDTGLAAVRAASIIATDVQVMKTLTDEVSLYQDLAGFEETWYNKKLGLLDKEIALLKEKYKLTDDVTAAMKAQGEMKIASDLWEKEHKNQKDMLKSTYDMIDATSEMFDKESRGYKAMMEMKKIAHVVEMAMNLEKAISTFALAQAEAAEAVAAQSTVPVAGFAMGAAMLAFMASVLGAAGISFGGGSASASAPVLPPSTVLGAEAGTGSESIQNSWEKLMDIDTLQYRELSGIHDSMKELNQNITGLVTSIVRNYDALTLTGVDLSPVLSGVQDWSNEYLGGGKNTWSDNWVSDMGDKVIEWLGWGSKSFTPTGGGIQVGGYGTGSLDDARFTRVEQSVNDFLNGIEVAAAKYTDIMVTGSKGDTWMNAAYAPLAADITGFLTLVYKNMSEGLVEIGTALGTDMAKVNGYVFETFKLDLSKYTTGEEINKALNDYFSKVADDAATALWGEFIISYQKLSEGPFQTAIRLASDMIIVMDTLSATGQHFTGSIPQIIAFSEAIIEMAGGLDKLQESASTYYDKFFNDAEKQARLQGQLSGALGDMGYALPGSRGGYRALVEGLNLTTDAGKQAYVMLMNFAEAADQYYSAVEDATGGTDKLTEALKRQSETVQKWLADLNKSTLSPVMSAQAQEAAYAAARGAAYAPGATEAQTNAFLTSANDYLKFARAYSGDYASIYQSVVGDVQALASAIAIALDPRVTIQPVQPGATASSMGTPSSGAGETYGFRSGHGYGYYADGGLMTRPSIGGEAGAEWAVPTYEPQRSRFLESAPPQFWENLRGGGAVSGGDRQIVVEVHSVTNLDGKVIAESTARQIPRNASLTEAIRRVN